MTKDFFGAFAATATLGWMPQVRRTLRRGTASDVAWSYLALYGTGLGLWIAYGLLRADTILLVGNVVGLVSVAVLAVVKLRSRLFHVEHLELVLPAGTDAAMALQSLERLGSRLAHDLRAVDTSDPDRLQAPGRRRRIDAWSKPGCRPEVLPARRSSRRERRGTRAESRLGLAACAQPTQDEAPPLLRATCRRD